MQEWLDAEVPLLSKTGVGLKKLVNLAPHLARSLRKAWGTKMQKIKLAGWLAGWMVCVLACWCEMQGKDMKSL